MSEMSEHHDACVAQMRMVAAEREGLWAVIYGLVPYLDGDQWCILLGENLQEGIAGFGDSPQAAILDFERAMCMPKQAGRGER